MIKLVFKIMLFVLVSSCTVKKQAVKRKTTKVEAKDVTTSVVRTIQEKRPGKQITTEIIPIEKRERDQNGQIKELIKEFKEGGLTKTILYKPDGSVNVQCIEDAIDRIITEKYNQRDNSVITEQTKEKEKQKEEKFNPAPFIYGLIALLVILFIAFFVMKRLIERSVIKKVSV
jgi:biopolymer transport protein ExbD